jgi:hypothetical protein
VSLVAPGGQIVVELIENLLEKSGVEAGGLPQLRRGRLDEGVRVERVGLRMLALKPAPMRGRLVLGSGYAARTQPSWRRSRSRSMRSPRLNLMSED